MYASTSYRRRSYLARPSKPYRFTPNVYARPGGNYRSSSRSTFRKGGPYRPAYRRQPYKTSQYKKRVPYRSSRLAKVEVKPEQLLVRIVQNPTLVGGIIPDRVPSGGFRARFTLITAPGVLREHQPEFNGNAQFVGLTCNTVYELDGGGPFVHRRIIFSSEVPWPCETLHNRAVAAGSTDGRGEFVRPPASDLSSVTLCAGLRRLFRQHNIRGTIDGPVNSSYVRVIKDEKFSCTGNSDGVRRKKKFWNSLKGTPPMRYQLMPNGSLNSALTNAPEAQHIYMLDLYSFGIGGMDVEIPDPRVLVQSGSMPASDSKKQKINNEPQDTVMSDFESYLNMDKMKSALQNPMSESDEDDVAISIEMKMYYRELKV